MTVASSSQRRHEAGVIFYNCRRVNCYNTICCIEISIVIYDCTTFITQTTVALKNLILKLQNAFYLLLFECKNVFDDFFGKNVLVRLKRKNVTETESPSTFSHDPRVDSRSRETMNFCKPWPWHHRRGEQGIR